MKKRRREGGGRKEGREGKHVSVSVRALAGKIMRSDGLTDLRGGAAYNLRKHTRMLSAQREAGPGRSGNS